MLCAEHNHVQRCGVQRQADHKDQGIADGKEDVLKIFVEFAVEGADIGLVALHLGCDDT